ncbi:insulinase family protein [Pelomonas sp. P7]|uniref:Insulinase family protein n=1 Tax=Pelomonas caseinilytica TaxID=2906763 RepID=A0ABS8XIT1_9BURK|nr:insulinase family protein [Pelomonas sp. P7]MCE4540767.1 insulinase family protein [Pelomonas sp. P7]
MTIAKLFATAFVCFKAAAAIAGCDALQTPVAAINGVTEYRLENGLQVILYPASDDPRTTVNVVYHVGSKDDPRMGSGTAHLLEHMMFRRTETHPQVGRELVMHDMQYNGITWVDGTSYFENFRSNEDNLKWAIGLEADRMHSLVIDAATLEVEKRVVINELQAVRQDPVFLVLTKARKAIYPNHPYGNSSVGSDQDVLAVSKEALEAFYRAHYRPASATLIVAGGFDAASALKSICENFGGIHDPKEIERESDNDLRGAPVAAVVTMETSPPSAGVIVRIGPRLSNSYQVASLVAPLYALDEQSPLQRILVGKRIASSVKAFADGFKDDGYIFFFAQANEGVSAEELKTHLLSAIGTSPDQLISTDDVRRLKVARDELFKGSLEHASTVDLALLDWLVAGDWRQYFSYERAIRESELSSLLIAARTTLGDVEAKSANTVAEQIASQAPGTTQPSKAIALGTGDGQPKGRTVTRAKPALELPVILKRARYSKDSGPNIAVLDAPNDQGTVSIAVRTLCRDIPSKMRWQASPVLQRLLLYALETPEGASLKSLIDASHGRMRFSADDQGVLLAFQLPASEVEEGLRRLAGLAAFDALAHPRTAQMLMARLTEVRLQRPDPRSMAIAAMHGTHPMRSAMVADEVLSDEVEAVQKLSPLTLATVWRGCFDSAFTGIAVVGDSKGLDTAIVRRALATWPERQPLGPSADHGAGGLATGAAAATINVPGGAYGFALVRNEFKSAEGTYSTPALTVANYLIGGTPAAYLPERLRNSLGISYSVASFFSRDQIAGGGVFGIFATFNNEELSNFRGALVSEIAGIRRKGFTTVEVREAIQSVVRERHAMLENELLIAATLAGMSSSGISPAEILAEEKKLLALNAAEVNEAARFLLDEKKLRFVFSGDFNRAAATAKKSSD